MFLFNNNNEKSVPSDREKHNRKVQSLNGYFWNSHNSRTVHRCKATLLHHSQLSTSICTISFLSSPSIFRLLDFPIRIARSLCFIFCWALWSSSLFSFCYFAYVIKRKLISIYMSLIYTRNENDVQVQGKKHTESEQKRERERKDMRPNPFFRENTKYRRNIVRCLSCILQ